jgi:O-antigen/teichoic acid export membrane protein
MMPISLIASSLSPVMFQRASVARDIREVEGLIRTLLTWLVRLSVPVFVVVAVAANRLAGILLGSSWQTVGVYVGVLAVPAWLTLQTAWLDRMLDRLGRQKLALTIEVVYSTVALTAVTIGLRVSHDGLVGVALFAAITAVYNVVWLLALFVVAEFHVAPLLWLGGEALGIAAITFGTIWLLTSLVPAVAAIAVSTALVILFEMACFKVARANVRI